MNIRISHVTCFGQWSLNKSDIYLPLLKRIMVLSGHDANFSQARIKRRAAGEPSGYVRGTKNKTLLLKATKI